MLFKKGKPFNLESEREAQEAGYIWAKESQDSKYGPYVYGMRPNLKSVATEEEARLGMVRSYLAYKKFVEDGEKEYLAKEQARLEKEATERALIGRAEEANARSAQDAGYSIKKRPNGLQGWTGGGIGVDWNTVDEAIDAQARDAQRNREHAAYRQRVATAIHDAGGEIRRQKGGYLAVYLPPAHDLAPKNGEIFNGLIFVFSGRGWADVEELMKLDAQRPDSYPMDE
ncbi:hypothetical protein CSTAT_09680 [Corynebacterium stationis]|nr:hypothetical protein CSTAT_09680 [Corynebacterium stationis]